MTVLWLLFFLLPSLVSPWGVSFLDATRGKAAASITSALVRTLTTTTPTFDDDWETYYGAAETSTDAFVSVPGVAAAAAAVSAGLFALLKSNQQFQERLWYMGKRTDGDDADRSYEFDPVTGSADEYTRVPEYLLSAMLAGSYFLPPEHLLKTASDVGRTMRYRSYRDLSPVWHEFTPPDTTSPFAFHAYADVPRLTYDDDSTSSPGSFRVYKFKLPAAPTTAAFNAALVETIVRDAEKCLGIAVSNAGGWHGTKDFFCNNPGAVPAVDALAAMADDAVRFAEADDFARAAAKRAAAAASSSLSGGAGASAGKLRTMEKVAAAEESWANINKNGHWNRLHSHAGACWSGVYYVQSDPRSLARRYSGSLLLKPTSHVSEAVHLDEDERARLFCSDEDNARAVRDGLTPSCCDYITIAAEPGMMVLFPSWLHHAVVPLSVKADQGMGGLRISMAFNALQSP